MGRRGGQVRIVFLGTPAGAVPCLEALLAAGYEVPLVVTQPDRPAGRSGTPLAPAVKQRSLRAGLRVFQPERVRRPEFLDAVASVRPDALVVVAFGRILPEPVLDVAPQGAVNVHFSLLPRYRGAAPVQWALAAGETVTGVTTIRMNALMDEGDVYLQAEVSVEPGEHAPALTARLATVGASLLLETLARVLEGSIEPRPQDPELATYAPRLRASDGEVSPALPAAAIEGRVRGFDPWPGAWIRHRGRRIRILDARATGGEPRGEAPGTVLDLTADGLPIVCGGGSVLAVRSLQPEGRRAMTARDAVNGRQLPPGETIEAG